MNVLFNDILFAGEKQDKIHFKGSMLEYKKKEQKVGRNLQDVLIWPKDFRLF